MDTLQAQNQKVKKNLFYYVFQFDIFEFMKIFNSKILQLMIKTDTRDIPATTAGQAIIQKTECCG